MPSPVPQGCGRNVASVAFYRLATSSPHRRRRRVSFHGFVLAHAVLSAVEAQAFAESWFRAWNAHDLDAMMAHYAEGIEHSSPFIARYNGDPSCAPLRGKAAVREYFGRALERNPTLRFDRLHVAVGVSSVALAYRRMTEELALETFELEGGRVTRSVSHYGI